MITFANQPEILILSLSRKDMVADIYQGLIAKLSQSAVVRHISTAASAVQYLEERHPRAILAADEALTLEENIPVLNKLVEYVRHGGLAIFGLCFPTFALYDNIDALFGDTFGLPWKVGAYTRTDIEHNSLSVLPLRSSRGLFPRTNYSKALYIKDAQPHEKIYIQINDPGTDSSSSREYTERALAAVVGATAGNGYVAFCGDVNPGAEFDKIVLSFFGFQVLE